MTDEQIIKALECCTIGTFACGKECPYYSSKSNLKVSSCRFDLMCEISNLINRQKEKIEALQMDNKQLQSDVINANQNWDHIKGLWECEKEKVESAKQKVICACKMLKTAKSEAYKECLAKVKNYIKTHCNPYGKPDFDYDTSIKILNFIDSFAQEM